ncbi:DUF6265 family protein [Fulvivirga sedimenti]|uniref:DUF6265 family protein n=1 Tax=Fulvivirga sedimenti TaxID=2879465 RepID=A0A9X1KY99_9BACT|nr:DUF6265 family protein [Fulvivirga sedimenti]MCA6073381.1 DUF6265 family protein [Fulvivirga sedimenti]
MRNIGIIGLVLFIASCKPVVKLPVEEEFGWLEANWVSTDGKMGEDWTYISAEDRLEGSGWELQSGDTVQTEIMQILSRRDKLFFMADTGEGSPVYFEITEKGSGYFVAGNPFHDFPTRIEYRRTGDRLNATAANDDRTVNFVFVRK